VQIVDRVALKLASTFPGYCERHERIFAIFEVPKKLSTPRDFELQILRSAARELQTADNMVEFFGAIQAAYEVLLPNLDLTVAQRKLLSTQLLEPVASLVSSKSIFHAHLYFLHNDLVDRMSSSDKATYVVAIRFDEVVPVCLSGSTSMSYSLDGSDTRSCVVIAVVIPNGDHSLILLATEKTDAEMLDHYARDYFGSVEQQRDSIISWMAHGTDHWFVNRSWWDELAPAAREELAEKTFDYEGSVTDRLDNRFF
jgi:hypothetical protein